jgi:hypothetical protein
MKNFILILLLFLLTYSSFIKAQGNINWFPLQPDIKYQFENTGFDNSRTYPLYYTQHIVTDSLLFQGKMFYKLNGYYYYFDQNEQKLYTFDGTQIQLSVDFTLPRGKDSTAFFNGQKLTFNYSGVYQATYFNAVRNCFSITFSAYNSKQWITQKYQYVFCENLGWVAYNSENHDYSMGTEMYYIGYSTAVSAFVNDTMYNPIVPVLSILDTLKDSRKDQFPLSVRAYINSNYPTFIDSVYANVTVSRNDSDIYKNKFNFTQVTGVAKIAIDTSILKVGDTVKVSYHLTDNSVYKNKIDLPANGTYNFSILSPLTSVKEHNIIVNKFNLFGFPNPFNPVVNIGYFLPHEGIVNLEIINSLGARIKVLESGIKSQGDHKITWNPGNSPSGIYFVRLRTEITGTGENFNKTIKLVYLK